MSNDATPATATPRFPINRSSRLRRLCQKELREILRDRRTIVTLILMPLLVYPLLSLVFQRFLLSQAAAVAANVPGIIVGVESEEAGATIEEYISVGHRLLKQSDAVLETPNLHSVVVNNLITPIREQRIDLAIRVTLLEPDKPPLFGPPPAEFAIFHRSGSIGSETAMRFFEDRFRAVNEEFLARKLKDIDVDVQPPIRLVRQPTEVDVTPSLSLASLVPLVLILMTITGAVYPSIDLTAGERERGTLEALIAAPVPRSDLLLAKYGAVVTVSMLTAAANLIGMGITLYSTGLGQTLFGDTQPLVPTLLMVFALLVLFALFFSAVLLAVTSFARSFKEAQAYLIPLMLLSLAPGIVSLSPGIELRGMLSFTPLVNIVLLARDVFAGTAQLAPAMAAILSTLIYAAIAIVIAGRIFGSDTALYGSQGTWSDWLQRPPIASSVASLSAAMMCLAILFPAYILLSNLLAQATTADMGTRLALASSVTVLLFGVIPIAFALIARIRVSTAFQIQPAKAMAFFAAGLLGVSLWPLAHEVFLLHRMLGIATLTTSKIEAVQAMVDAWQKLPWGLLFITLAIIPAVFEELFFRGFLFSSLLKHTSKVKAIVASSVLFGIFHVVSSTLAVERFLPSTFIGLALAWLCLRTGSILPGILLHACHNGLLVTMGYYEDWLTANNFGTQTQIHLPPLWLTWAVIGTIAAILVVRFFVTPFDDADQLALEKAD